MKEINLFSFHEICEPLQLECVSNANSFFINGDDRHYEMDGNENILSSLTSLSYCKYLIKIY